MEIQRLCVIGAGALGLYLSRNFAPKSQVLLLSRGQSFAELKSFKPDAIFICVKAHQLQALSSQLAPFISGDSVLVLCCNGLGMYFQLATELRAKPHILRLLPNVGVLKNGNQITVSGKPETFLASTPQDQDLRQSLEIFLQSLGWTIHIEKDIATAEWKKLLTNMLVNTLASICDAPNGIVLDNPQLKELAQKLLIEIRTVALADGFDLSSPTDKQIFDGISNHRSNICSTLVDLHAGRPTEMDYILGRFLRLASDYGIATPIAQTLFAIIKAMESKLA